MSKLFPLINLYGGLALALLVAVFPESPHSVRRLGVAVLNLAVYLLAKHWNEGGNRE